MTPKRICFVEAPPPLTEAFRSLGCEVLPINPGPETTVLNLPQALEEHGFRPDIVLQREHLGRRLFLAGLDHIDCPRIFWALDPHLNAYWHSCYAKLFDLTATTQPQCDKYLCEYGAVSAHLPWHGEAVDWHPFSKRPTFLGFVGRVTPERPLRHWMVNALQGLYGEHFVLRDGLSFNEMLDFYGTVRLAPNESILGEVNFRLFETASCGCVPITQDLGPAQEALFEPGKEMVTYSDIAEMRAIINSLLKNEKACRAMARAAWERVQRDHLPLSRAKSVLEMAHALPRRAAESDHDKWFTLAAARFHEQDRMVMPQQKLVSRLMAKQDDPDILTAIIRLQALADDRPGMLSQIARLYAANLFADHADLNLTASMAALRCGESGQSWELAVAFLVRQLRQNDRPLPPMPQTPVALLNLWAKELLRHGKDLRNGFPFDLKRHLPGTASHCLILALKYEPENLEILNLLNTTCSGQLGLEHFRIGLLSTLTLHRRNDWRLGLDLALANLRGYRLEQGLEELLTAWDLAKGQDMEKSFRRVLGAKDPKGTLAGLLTD